MSGKQMTVTMNQSVAGNAIASSENNRGIEAKMQLLQMSIAPTKLTTIEELVLRRVLDGESYTKIALELGYNHDYIKSVGSKLWQFLSKAWGEPITKRNIFTVIQRQLTSVKAYPTTEITKPAPPPKTQDWEEAIDTSFFLDVLKNLLSYNNGFA